MKKPLLTSGFFINFFFPILGVCLREPPFCGVKKRVVEGACMHPSTSQLVRSGMMICYTHLQGSFSPWIGRFVYVKIVGKKAHPSISHLVCEVSKLSHTHFQVFLFLGLFDYHMKSTWYITLKKKGKPKIPNEYTHFSWMLVGGTHLRLD